VLKSSISKLLPHLKNNFYHTFVSIQHIAVRAMFNYHLSSKLKRFIGTKLIEKSFPPCMLGKPDKVKIVLSVSTTSSEKAENH
jgi:hypothetical protein